jgi:hypothetical protein
MREMLSEAFSLLLYFGTLLARLYYVFVAKKKVGGNYEIRRTYSYGNPT